jgi:hypothetical protein
MYQAIITKIKVFKHPNADRIQLGHVCGYQVIVGKEIKTGDLGVYFPTDGQLSNQFCAENDLIAYKDDQGNKKGRYFSHKRRVTSQKFRGEKSEGFWMPISSLAFTGYDVYELKEGMALSELNSIPICNKYITPATMRSITRTSKIKRNNCFAKHSDTKQLKHEIGNIPIGSVIYITEKMHGTSGRFGYVLDEIKKSRKEILLDILKFNGYSKTKKEYNHLNGSRNVILGLNLQRGFYGNDSFRKNVTLDLENRLHKGEIIYYEIVGYTTEGSLIMPAVDTSSLKDKEFTKKYGKIMEYKYKQLPGICKIYVYNITRVNEDGNVITLSWEQIKRRCNELGIDHAPELDEKFIYNGDKLELFERIEKTINGESVIDQSHIREGVCLRIEHEKITILKDKSFAFKVLEGITKADDNYIDIEEAN